jgi:hypothetical protein
MTGRGEVGLVEIWLWNVKLTPMFFGQKSQWVVNYKTNNMGEQVENEGNILALETVGKEEESMLPKIIG